MFSQDKIRVDELAVPITGHVVNSAFQNKQLLGDLNGAQMSPLFKIEDE